MENITIYEAMGAIDELLTEAEINIKTGNDPKDIENAAKRLDKLEQKIDPEQLKKINRMTNITNTVGAVAGAYVTDKYIQQAKKISKDIKELEDEISKEKDEEVLKELKKKLKNKKLHKRVLVLNIALTGSMTAASGERLVHRMGDKVKDMEKPDFLKKKKKVNLKTGNPKDISNK